MSIIDRKSRKWIYPLTEKEHGTNTTDKRYKDPAWLAAQWKDKTPADIANLCNASVSTIYMWAKKFDLATGHNRQNDDNANS